MAVEKLEEKKCKIEGCKGTYRAKGYCQRHYKKWRHGEYGGARYKTCKQEGCLKPVVARALCEEHYKAWKAAREAKKGGAPKAPVAEAKETPTAPAAA